MKTRRLANCFVQVQKELFMGIIRILSLLYPSKKKAQNKIAYLMSFPRNDNGLILKIVEELEDTKLILFYEKNCQTEAQFFSTKGVEIHSLERSFYFFRVVIFKLCQSKIIICDNYYAFLGALQLAKKSKVLQLWHANGAIKCFGWEDKQTSQRTKLDQRRFSNVYHRFDDYIVGSKKMGAVFQRSYGAKATQIKYLGYPRTDLFLDQKQLALTKKTIYAKHPRLKYKKLMLYAPTYRLTEQQVPINITQLEEAFGDEYFLVIKAHPHTVQSLVEPVNKDFYYQALAEYKMEELLPMVDCLITDYSSLPFDYSLVRPTGNIIFYWYDYIVQKNKIGIQTDFDEWNPGTVVFTMDELIAAIHQIQPNDLAQFNQEWNEYNDGHSTKRMIAYLKKLVK
ncbi:CDP-glycerol glycerophosphotransferase family protein [Carnobacterium divergens]|uniref:CDP-glycerol glycerophosphotransferase family protein n=1 Tax=Carnobacterium divergens TaxID=2748 RepID=UPI0007F4BE32|nr:CDP-glycerol glycerophosphotransferase family protein [Carnobacterium divergens]SBO18535.1 putative CDP-glycerol--undecaprenyl-pyrophosphoryl-N-acetylglucosaminyl-N-acetylmannosamine glycerophosphotransferase [Carnobacterium divergens]